MARPPSTIGDRSWEHLRYHGAPVKQHVLADFPDSTTPLLRDRVWGSFKQHCAEEGNLIPLLISELEPQDHGMFQRHGPRKPKGSDPFCDLPFIQRLEAEERFRRMCEKWEGNLPSWRRAILAGVARRLTLHPPGSEWGKRMRRIKGGVHCQRKYRERGGHPLEAFNQAMAKRRKANLDACEDGKQGLNGSLTPAQEARNRLGITPEQMRGVARVDSILKSIEGAFERAVNALRGSREEDAREFLQKYNSIPPADLEHLTFDEICVAAGVDPRQVLTLAVDGMVKIFSMKTTLILASNLPKVTEVMIQSARTAKGVRDRRLFFEITGILPYTPRRNALAPIIDAQQLGTRPGALAHPRKLG